MSDAATIELEGWRKAFPGKTPGEVRAILENAIRYTKRFALLQRAHGIDVTAPESVVAEGLAALGRVEVKE